jgi:hypothetical protein
MILIMYNELKLTVCIKSKVKFKILKKDSTIYLENLEFFKNIILSSSSNSFFLKSWLLSLIPIAIPTKTLKAQSKYIETYHKLT